MLNHKYSLESLIIIKVSKIHHAKYKRIFISINIRLNKKLVCDHDYFAVFFIAVYFYFYLVARKFFLQCVIRGKVLFVNFKPEVNIIYLFCVINTRIYDCNLFEIFACYFLKSYKNKISSTKVI